MPVEHETKHVLSLATAKSLMEELSARHPLLEIEQFYVRLDNTFLRTDGPDGADGFVHRAENKWDSRIGIVETAITEEDFELARLACVDGDPTSEVFATPTGNRFRRTFVRPVGGEPTGSWTHTYKIMADGRLLEIEREVTPETFTFSRLGREESLCKVRFSIEAPDAHWDVDFLLTAPLEEGGEIYFAMAEAETGEHESFEPLPELAGHIEFQVPHGRSAWFTNRKLADPDYAATVVELYLASEDDKPGRNR